MRIFITGATGFIGLYLVKELLEKGHQIKCLKRKTSDMSKFMKLRGSLWWTDIADNWQDEFLTFQPEVVFNLAWDGVSSCDRVVWTKQVNNIIMQQKLLDLSAMCGVQKFIGIGSQSEYGDFEGIIDENYPANPKTAYAASKIACLDLLRCFCEINNIEWYWFRLFPLFGPYESDKWLIPSLIKAMCTRESMDLTLGEQQLPYLYVGECAKAIASVTDASGKSGVYNVCADNPRPLKNLITLVRDKVNPNFKLCFGALKYRFGQSMFMCSKTDKLADNLYLLNTSSFEEKLNETINYYISLYGKN